MPYINAGGRRTRTSFGYPMLSGRYPRPVSVFLPTRVDPVTQNRYTAVVSSTETTLESFDRGQALRGRGGDGFVLELSILPYFAPPATVLAVWRQATNANGTFFGFAGSGASGGWRCGLSTSIYRVTWGGVADYDSGVSYDQNKTNVVAFALGGNGSNYDLVENGAHRATVSTGGTINTPSLRGSFMASNESSGSQYYTNLIAVWNQRLPVGMLLELTRDPSLLFVQQPLLYKPSAALFNPAWAVSANSVVSSGVRAA